jgi:hypothetical protein
MFSSVTVVVWWVVLVPLIYCLLKDPEQRNGFMKFNFHPFLILIHFLNLPMALVEFWAVQSKFTFGDLWAGVLVAVVYILFYLCYLDARGYHFYIVFTPRTPLCFFTYSSILLLYWGLYCFYNAMLN